MSWKTHSFDNTNYTNEGEDTVSSNICPKIQTFFNLTKKKTQMYNTNTLQVLKKYQLTILTQVVKKYQLMLFILYWKKKWLQHYITFQRFSENLEKVVYFLIFFKDDYLPTAVVNNEIMIFHIISHKKVLMWILLWAMPANIIVLLKSYLIDVFCLFWWKIW